MNHDVRIGQDLMDASGNFTRNLLRSLESEISRQSEGNVGEIAISGAPDAHSVNFQHSFDPANYVHDLRSHTRRSRIEQGIHCSTSKPPTHVDHHASHE